jgi:hypothetical protein
VQEVTLNSAHVTESTQDTRPRSNHEVKSEPDDLTRLREENAQLITTLRDLTHAQLISRDLELGLRAELMQARIDILHAHATGAHEVDKVRTSMSWRIGRAITKPLGVVRRLGRLGRLGK